MEKSISLEREHFFSTFCELEMCLFLGCLQSLNCFGRLNVQINDGNNQEQERICTKL
jgi:hypothetical protein